MKKEKPTLDQTHSHLLAEWDYEKNAEIGLFPNKVSHGSHKIVWWKCLKNKEHPYPMMIKKRTRKDRPQSCSYCAGKRVNHTNCLSTTHPHLLLEWDYEENDKVDLFPGKITPGSDKKVSWKCSNGHKWVATISSRANKKYPNGCAVCAGQRPDKNTCFSATHPHLLEEWDYERNNSFGIYPNEIMAGTNKKVWWKCLKNKEHSYDASPNDRTRKDGKSTNCSYCAGLRVNHTNCLSTTHPHLLEEWDYERNKSTGITPEKITSGSNKKVWWKCSKNEEHLFPMMVKARTKKDNPEGCSYCVGHRVNHTNCLSTTHPNLLEEWDWILNGFYGIFPEKITYSSNKKVNWMCSNGHLWKTSPSNRTGKNLTNCPLCTTVISRGHQEVIDFIKSLCDLELSINDRKTIINPYSNYYLELDIFIPSIKLAIEYNGNYYHSNKIRKNVEETDVLKQILCAQKEITLLTVWENEWKNNQDMVKNNILSFFEKEKRYLHKD